MTRYVDPRIHAPACPQPPLLVARSASGRWWVHRCPDCDAVRLEAVVSS